MNADGRSQFAEKTTIFKLECTKQEQLPSEGINNLIPYPSPDSLLSRA